MTKKKIALLAIPVVAVLGGIVLTGSVIAQEVSSPLNDFHERFAEKLGVETETFCDAKKEVQIEMVDEKVAAGDLDSDRAEDIKQSIEESECGRMPHRRGRPRVNPEELAEFLGISVEELHTAKEDGRNLRELAEEQGISEEDLRSFLRENGRGMRFRAVPNKAGMGE